MDPDGIDRAPDALVLGGGGILGEAWMSSVLVGLERAGGFAAAQAGMFVGTSAGSIVAAMLAARVNPAGRLGALPEPPEAGGEAPAGEGQGGLIGAIAQGIGGPLAALVLNPAAPGGRMLRRSALSRVPRGRRSLAGLGGAVDATGVGFDGRLRICAVDLERGERVIFGAPEAPETAVGIAVEASCAIPGVFRPVEIASREYVDGGVWSPTNMDAAEVGDGSHVVCLNPTGSMRPGGSQRLGWLGPLSRTVATIEATALRRRGVKVTVVSPDADASAAIGERLMRASARGTVIEAGFAQGAAMAYTMPSDEHFSG
jgi:NTE family protein